MGLWLLPTGFGCFVAFLSFLVLRELGVRKEVTAVVAVIVVILVAIICHYFDKKDAEHGESSFP